MTATMHCNSLHRCTSGHPSGRSRVPLNDAARNTPTDKPEAAQPPLGSGCSYSSDELPSKTSNGSESDKPIS